MNFLHTKDFHAVTTFVTISFLAGLTYFLCSSNFNLFALAQKPPEVSAQVKKFATLNRTNSDYDNYRKRIFDSINSYRTSKSLKPLSRNTILDNSTCSKVEDMENNKYWGHHSLNGLTYNQIISDKGYKYFKAGETLYGGINPNPDEIVKSWEKSKNHNQILTDSVFEDIGICVKQIKIPFSPEWPSVGDPNTVYTSNNLVSENVIVTHFGKPY